MSTRDRSNILGNLCFSQSIYIFAKLILKAARAKLEYLIVANFHCIIKWSSSLSSLNRLVESSQYSSLAQLVFI